MIKRKLLTCSLLTCMYMSYGQDGPPNPNSVKGDVGGDVVNVDPYTGTGSVNIPIYDYSVDGLSLGVSLSYVAKGIRVDEIASSVGLGWSLNAGGEISRQVNGLEDEATLPSPFSLVQFNTRKYRGVLVPGANEPNTPGDDVSRDMFMANIGGRSISFFIKNDSTYITHPGTGYKIDLITKNRIYVGNVGWVDDNIRSGVKNDGTLNETDNILTFNITDEKGNKFFFDRGDYLEKEYDMSILNPSTGTYYPTQSWKLDKIITHSGQEIKYTYQSNELDYMQSLSESTFVGYPFYKSKTMHWKGMKYHISKIEYPNGTSVSFDLDNSVSTGRCDCEGNFRLKNIIIEGKYDNNVKNKITYSLDQAYFNTPKFNFTATEYSLPYTCASLKSTLSVSGSNTDSVKDTHFALGLRLKLKGLKRKGTDNTTEEYFYSFNYNNNPLPYRLSPKVDYYGFYNGNTPTPTDPDYYDGFGLNGDLSGIPYHEDNSNYWGAHKAHNHDSMQAFVMTKVKNGFGGEVEIQYTPYQLSNPSCRYVGDLSPTVQGRCNLDMGEIEGDTVNDGLVVGKLISTDAYNVDFKTTTEYLYEYGERFYSGGYVFTTAGYSNYFVDPHDTYSGSNHGFTNTTVTVKGFNDEQITKTKYTFSNLIYVENGTTYSNLSKVTLLKDDVYKLQTTNLRKHNMGQILSVEKIDGNNRTIQLDEFAFTAVDMPGTINHSNGALTEISNATWLYNTPINFFPTIKLQSSHTINRKVYNNTIPTGYRTFQTIYNYTYNDKFAHTSTTWSDSKGNNYVKYKKYNYDYKDMFSGVPALDSMHNRNNRSVMSYETWRKNSSTDSVLMKYNIEVPFVPTSGNISLKFPASFASFGNEPLTGNSTQIDKSKALNFKNYSTYGTNLLKTSEHELYDNSDNILQTKYNNLEQYNSYIWDAELGLKLADITNAKYADVAFTSFESNYLPVTSTDYSKGNWLFDPADKKYYLNAGCSSTMTGKHVYELKTSAQNNIEKVTLGTNKYIVSFWLHSSAAATATLYNGGSSLGTVSLQLANTVGNWKLYQGTFTASSGNSLKITNNTSSAMYIDELRLHPADAVMVSYTHKPLFGIGSKTEANNYISYFEYDPFGRLVITRDMRQNIVWKKEYKRNDADTAPTNNGNSNSNGSY